MRGPNTSNIVILKDPQTYAGTRTALFTQQQKAGTDLRSRPAEWNANVRQGPTSGRSGEWNAKAYAQAPPFRHPLVSNFLHPFSRTARRSVPAFAALISISPPHPPELGTRPPPPRRHRPRTAPRRQIPPAKPCWRRCCGDFTSLNVTLRLNPYVRPKMLAAAFYMLYKYKDRHYTRGPSADLVSGAADLCYHARNGTQNDPQSCVSESCLTGSGGSV